MAAENFKAAELAEEYRTKVELGINLKTANAEPAPAMPSLCVCAPKLLRR
jgi:hypothetical protein